MFEEREQNCRRKFFCDCLRDQARKNSSRRVHQRIAAGIVDVEIPASKCGHHAPRQCAIGCYQSGRDVLMPRFAHRNCNREGLHFRIRSLDHGEFIHTRCNSWRDLGLGQPHMPHGA